MNMTRYLLNLKYIFIKRHKKKKKNQMTHCFFFFKYTFLPVVDKAVYMVGSYGPRAEEHEFLTPVEEAPKGMIVRGSYHIKSYFTDDDKTDHLSWEWNLHIKKDWDSAE